MSTRGARLKRLYLKEYRTAVASDSPKLELIGSQSGRDLPLGVEILPSRFDDARVVYRASRESLSVTGGSTDKILFEGMGPGGEVVEKEIRFTNGSYNKKSGFTSYVKNEIPSVLKSLNKLHIAPSKEPKHMFTILYATALLFLAISSFWMYKPESKLFKRGVFTSIFGAFVSILLVAL